MIKFTDENFEKEALKPDLPVFVYFSADWCGPCKMASLVIEELVKEYQGKIKIGKLDVDKNPQTAQKYGVMSIPTVIIFKKSKELKRQVGFPGKEAYKKLIEEVVNA